MCGIVCPELWPHCKSALVKMLMAYIVIDVHSEGVCERLIREDDKTGNGNAVKYGSS